MDSERTALQDVARPIGPSAVPITLRINDVDHHLEVESRVSLLDAFREYLHLTGTKKGLQSGSMRRLHCSMRWRANTLLHRTCRPVRRRRNQDRGGSRG